MKGILATLIIFTTVEAYGVAVNKKSIALPVSDIMIEKGKGASGPGAHNGPAMVFILRPEIWVKFIIMDMTERLNF